MDSGPAGDNAVDTGQAPWPCQVGLHSFPRPWSPEVKVGSVHQWITVLYSTNHIYAFTTRRRIYVSLTCSLPGAASTRHLHIHYQEPHLRVSFTVTTVHKVKLEGFMDFTALAVSSKNGACSTAPVCSKSSPLLPFRCEQAQLTPLFLFYCSDIALQENRSIA